MVNTIQLVGRLGREPERRDSEKENANFSIAVDDGFGGKKQTTWVPIKFYGKNAENVLRMLGKGDLVWVEGKLTMFRPEPEKLIVYVTGARFRKLSGKNRAEPLKAPVGSVAKMGNEHGVYAEHDGTF